jgi:hypothetical protein
MRKTAVQSGTSERTMVGFVPASRTFWSSWPSFLCPPSSFSHSVPMTLSLGSTLGTQAMMIADVRRHGLVALSSCLSRSHSLSLSLSCGRFRCGCLLLRPMISTVPAVSPDSLHGSGQIATHKDLRPCRVNTWNGFPGSLWRGWSRINTTTHGFVFSLPATTSRKTCFCRDPIGTNHRAVFFERTNERRH